MRRWAPVLLSAAALVIPLQGKRALTLGDYYGMESVSGPALSPDGRWVAVVRTVVLEEENRRHSEIWLAAVDGSSPPRRITNPGFSSSAPLWSPDGSLLAFSSQRPGPGGREASGSIWFLRLDRPGEAFQIPGVEGTPLFSPDNRWIAFSRRLPPPGIETRHPGEFERQIEQRFDGRIYDWMQFRFDRRGYLPDPRTSPPRELWVVAREGGTPRQLTRLGVDVSAPAWSPDATRLVFTADGEQRDEHSYERADLFVVDLEGRVRRLTDDPYHYSLPDWSPDGTSIVTVRRQGLDMVIAARRHHGSARDLFRLPAGGGDAVNLTSNWDLIPGAPSWGTGDRIYFAAVTGGNRHLFQVDASGVVSQITRGERTLSGISFSADLQTMAWVASDSSHPPELFAFDGREHQLTHFNREVLEEVELSRARKVRYPSRDGTSIEGWVLPPYGYREGRTYPLILTIHGGPHSAYGDRFSFHHQLLAARGYLVLFTNPRGSTGYGEEFLWATWGGWGDLDFHDLMAGVDHAISEHPVDETRMGVTGGSYGGFLTNWTIAHTTRFAAAVARASISNWISDYGTADIPRTKESEFYGPPWKEESAELLWRQSPLRYAGNVRTPTLFIHGEIDYRVPIEQAEQMYTALQKQGVPARFIRYPESYHGGWTPWRQVHALYQELLWWERYLAAGSPSRQ